MCAKAKRINHYAAQPSGNVRKDDDEALLHTLLILNSEREHLAMTVLLGDRCTNSAVPYQSYSHGGMESPIVSIIMESL